jgi:hypothetical protein
LNPDGGHFESPSTAGTCAQAPQSPSLYGRYRRSWPWLLVEPTVGRAVFFSSGWENIHGIKPVTSGERWAFSVPLTVDDELRVSRDGGVPQQQSQQEKARVVREACGRPADKSAFQRCLDDVQQAPRGGGAPPQLSQQQETARAFRKACVLPPDKFAFQECREQWASIMSEATSGETAPPSTPPAETSPAETSPAERGQERGQEGDRVREASDAGSAAKEEL